MLNHKVNILGIGFCSNYGNYKDSCAAARAGITRFSSHDDITFAINGEEDSEKLVVAAAPEYLDGYQGYGRLIKLMQLAYRDLCSNINSHIEHEKTQIYFALPDPLERNIESDHIDETVSRQERLVSIVEKITEPLLGLTDPLLKKCSVQCKFGGRSAFSGALDKAIAAVVNNECEQSLIFVADTFLDSSNLQAHLYNNDLKTPDNPVGFIPGEGGAAILISRGLSRDTHPQGTNVDVSVDMSVSEPANDIEAKIIGNDKIFFDLLRNHVERNNSKSLPLLVSDANGEVCKAMELSKIRLMLLKEYPDLSHQEPLLPALNHGEAGVITAAYGFSYAFEQIIRNKVSNISMAILLSDKSGRLSVIHLSSSEGEF